MLVSLSQDERDLSIGQNRQPEDRLTCVRRTKSIVCQPVFHGISTGVPTVTGFGERIRLVDSGWNQEQLSAFNGHEENLLDVSSIRLGTTQ